MPTPLELLHQRFRFDRFLPGQEQVIDTLLAGRSALAVFPTGAGKSLCFQLPALVLDGLTVVISPLIALMKDQVDALVRLGIDAARLDSTLSKDDAFDLYNRLESGNLAILYVAPERLSNERFLARLRGKRVALLAIDEAHCISEWGHNFRPDYLKLAQLARDLAVERVLALTATATPQVSSDIRDAFSIAPDDHIQTGFHRPNLHLRSIATTAEQRTDVLLQRLIETTPGPTIVYVTLQRTATAVADILAKHGYDARAYHAGMADEDRHAVQDAFMTGRCDIVVATIAFGMGIDKADIRRIFHYNLPKTLENYVQEIGRAGRDGNPSVCELLAAESDRVVLANFSYGDTPADAAVAALVEDLVAGADDEFHISQYDLSSKHDIRQLVVATAVTYLELDKILAATGPFYTAYKVKPLRSLRTIYEGFDERRTQFLRQLFQSGKEGRTWLTIEVADAQKQTGSDRKRIVAALDYLEGRGDIELQVTGLRHGYRRLRRPNLDELAASMIKRFQKREKQDIDRLDTMVRYVSEPGCRTRKLLDYFGEDLGKECGHCMVCDGEPRSASLRRTAPALPGARERGLIQDLIAQNHPALADPRQLTRFLCGLSSPAATRARLSRHPQFGALDEMPFAAVLAVATELTS